MDPVAGILFEYLRGVIYSVPNTTLEVEKLPAGFQDLGAGLQFFAECVIESNALALALSKGNMDAPMPSRGNEVAAPLKGLYASLMHLTWQANQIAQGDYSQRVDFMGEFSNAFNMMVEQLAERQQSLEDQIVQIQAQALSMRQSSALLNNLLDHVPLAVITLDKLSHDVLFVNEVASGEMKKNPAYLAQLLELLAPSEVLEHGGEADIEFEYKGHVNYLEVKAYPLAWEDSSAIVLAISDASAAQRKIRALEVDAYTDNLTQLYNRAYGMLTLNSWMHNKKQFIMAFADLDKLKYINDEFGHNDGDMYIINAGKHLRTFSADAVVCRLGGDEFMLLAPDTTYEAADAAMARICKSLSTDEFLQDKSYSYSMSYGIIQVDSDERRTISDILSLADERMYENKRQRKMQRQA